MIYPSTWGNLLGMKRLITVILIVLLGVSPKTCETSCIKGNPIMLAAEEFNLDSDILLAICHTESRCKPGSVNHDDGTKHQKSKGIKSKSYGLFQIKLATARSLGFKGTPAALMNAKTNAHYAAKLLRLLYRKYKSTPKVISAYNAGRYTEANSAYVGKVLATYARLKVDGAKLHEIR